MNTTNEQGVVLITGAAKRIGKAIAEHLHGQGYSIALHYHHSEKDALALIHRFNEQRAGSAIGFKANLSAKDEVQGLIKEVQNLQLGLKALINNASMYIADDKLDELSLESLHQLNSATPYQLSTGLYPSLKQCQGGIINITDIYAKTPLKNYEAYCESKTALEAQTRDLARRFAPEVRVNAVAPGVILWAEGDNEINNEAQQSLLNKIWLKRMGAPKYIAQTCAFLIDNDYITGESINVDGGLLKEGS